MGRAAEAVIEPSGKIRLLEPLIVTKPTRVIVTVIPDQVPDEATPTIVTVEGLEHVSKETGGSP